MSPRAPWQEINQGIKYFHTSTWRCLLCGASGEALDADSAFDSHWMFAHILPLAAVPA